MTKAQVSYELRVFQELPPRTHGGGAGKSILNEQLDHIKNNDPDPNGNPIPHNTPVCIGLYAKGTAATAAKNVLQQRYGRTAAVTGWTFATRRIPRAGVDGTVSEDAEYDTGLFAEFAPQKVVEGALALHERAEAKRKADLKAAREAEVEAEAEDLEADEEEDDEEEDGDEYSEGDDEYDEEDDPEVVAQ